MNNLLRSLKTLILCLALSSSVLAAELVKDQAATIYALAHALSKLSMPLNAPEIRLVSNERLQELLCQNGCSGVKGGHMNGIIYLDEKLDMQNVRNASIVFHEMVHFLQWANKGSAQDCDDWYERELVAYQLQNEVLYKAGARLVQMPSDLKKYCTEE